MASLGAMRSELRGIIQELESIASGLASEFEGIGSEVAAAKIRDLAHQCESSLHGLNNVDPSNVSEEFKKKEKATT